MPQLQAIVQINREKEQKQQHTTGTESILPIGVLNYSQKSSVRSDSGATWTTTSLRLENSWHAKHHPKATDIRAKRSSLELTSFSYAKKKQLTH
ncbi:hypothetical protein TNCV_2430401 [Trichonephila clavipes]|nr:hypothetical protein TNCV_2430401 [Trichonephila clavipes]